MNPNFFPPNPYRNSFGNNGPDESPARSPMMGGGLNSYRSFASSPPYRPHGPPRPCAPGHFARQPHPYGWNSESSSPLSANSPSRGGFLHFSTTNATSPRYRSPAEVSFDKTTSTPYQNQSGNRGSYRPGRGSNRFSNSGHLSWSGTPSGSPSYNMAGIKRQSSGFNRQNDCNPGGSSEISNYYSPSMLTDPWLGLLPVSANPSTRRVSLHR